MKRRTALKRMGAGLAYSVSVPAMLSIISCQDAGKLGASAALKPYEPMFVSKDNFAILNNFLDVLLPATKTPGAKELGIMQNIDTYTSEMWEDKEKIQFKKGLNVFTRMLNGAYGLEDNDIHPDNWKIIAEKYYGSGSEPIKERAAKLFAMEEDEISPADTDFYYLCKFFNKFKGLAIGTYFAHQNIAENHLSYDKVPGVYKGCIPLSEVGNSYSIGW